MFAAQQNEELPVGASWDYYFPFNATNVRADETYPTSFVALMRYSFHRPRDILTILDILKERYDEAASKPHFEYGDLFTSDFKRTYGNYLLGELKDSLSFYYDEDEFETFLKFFEFLDGKQKFSYEQYVIAFEEFSKFLKTKSDNVPGFMKKGEEFLQFLYHQNILSFVEHTDDERFIRWCFIERSPSNISPKVKIGMDYEIHYGLANVLNTGKEIKSARRNVLGNVKRGKQEKKHGDEAVPVDMNQEFYLDYLYSAGSTKDQSEISLESDKRPAARRIGKIKFINRKKQYGFITQIAGEHEVHFKLSLLPPDVRLNVGSDVDFELVTELDGRLSARDLRKL